MPEEQYFYSACSTAQGQWVAEIVPCTASLPEGSGKWNFCNALPRVLGSGQPTSCNLLSHCTGAMGSGNRATHFHTTCGQWVAQLVQCSASLTRGTGRPYSCNAPSHCLGAVGRGTHAMHFHTTWGQWEAQLLQCAASVPRGRGHWNSCNALPHCLGAAGSGSRAMHGVTA